MKNRVREIWLEYRSEGLFGLVLMVCAAVSHWLSYHIPVELFDGVITAIQNTCTATVCFFGAVLMFVHSEGIRIRKAWGWVLLIWGLFDTFFLIQTYFLHMPVLNIGDDAMSAFQLLVANLLAWLLLVYPQEAIRPNWLTFPKAVWQLLPMCALVGLDYLLPVDLRYVIMCYPVLLGVILTRHVRAYRLWCEQNFSTMDNIDVQWIVRYLVMVLVLGLSLFYMCLTDNPARAFTQPLEEWLDKEKPYLNPEFQLMDLRQVLPLNRSYLSQLINSEYGCTFYQWVNDLRIEEAKRLMREQPEIKIQEVSDRCGFSSRVTFHRTFLRETGQTPSEWIAAQNTFVFS